MVVEVIQKSWLPGNTGLIEKYERRDEKEDKRGKEKYKKKTLLMGRPMIFM